MNSDLKLQGPHLAAEGFLLREDYLQAEEHQHKVIEVIENFKLQLLVSKLKSLELGPFVVELKL